MHVGFTGTRRGMSPAQHARVTLEIDRLGDIDIGFATHHGLCVGADEEFHYIVRVLPRVRIVGHPGPDWPTGELCARITDCDEVLAPAPYMRRNAAIVAASQVMIAAPYEDVPQPRGGTWATIGMARRALRDGKLRELYVVGRSGELLDHTRWP